MVLQALGHLGRRHGQQVAQGHRLAVEQEAGQGATVKLAQHLGHHHLQAGQGGLARQVPLAVPVRVHDDIDERGAGRPLGGTFNVPVGPGVDCHPFTAPFIAPSMKKR